ncbi:histone deacetylase 10, chloroplastic-like [Miscanthus floridulus]|uniref:histone deacetylase 10, chloroplastic-like n=1 Tax=Miscanthus floridulus TaxID=154761 RepID=UPI00345A1407
MGISAKWLRSLVGLRKVERQQRYRKEDADVGVGPRRMEAHPKSNKRVLAIVDALKKLELSPKHRGSQVLEIQNFNPTSLDDVARIHSRSYITGLEKHVATGYGLSFR